MSLSEAIEVTTQLLQRDASATIAHDGDGRQLVLTRREAEALSRLVADATITLNQISAGVLRREGRSR
jgi:hypothetical protein